MDNNDYFDELKTMIYALIETEKPEDFELEEWTNQQGKVYQFLEKHVEISNVLEEEIWHFLIDIDIRIKDAEYGDTQRSIVQSLLEKG